MVTRTLAVVFFAFIVIYCQHWQKGGLSTSAVHSSLRALRQRLGYNAEYAMLGTSQRQ